MKNNSDKKLNPWISFLLFIVVPLVIAMTIITVILSLAGFNVIDWTKEKAASVFSLEADKTPTEENEQKNLQQAQNKIKEQTEDIEELAAEILFLEGTIDRLNNELLQAENRATSNQDESSANGVSQEEKEEVDLVKEIADSFKTMRNKQAAKIMEELSDEIALSILSELPKDIRGSILEAMDPERAANLTTSFINR